MWENTNYRKRLLYSSFSWDWGGSGANIKPVSREGDLRLGRSCYTTPVYSELHLFYPHFYIQAKFYPMSRSSSLLNITRSVFCNPLSLFDKFWSKLINDLIVRVFLPKCLVIRFLLWSCLVFYFTFAIHSTATYYWAIC